MPIEVRVDVGRGLVEMVLRGTLTEADFEAASRSYRAAAPPTTLPLGLVDLGGVDTGAIETSKIGELARRAIERVDPERGPEKVALVAPTEELFGLSRMYQAQRRDSPARLEVFRTRREAKLCLDL